MDDVLIYDNCELQLFDGRVVRPIRSARSG